MPNLNVKAGDKVIVHSGRWNRKRTFISKVEKITPKGFIKVDGVLYHPYGSERTANSYYLNWIEECTEEKEMKIIQENRIKFAINKMQAVQELTFEQATKILEILEEK